MDPLVPAGRDGPKTGLRNWLSDLGLDTAKLALFLYLLGLITSSLYYSRFSILTLDLAKTQCILVGVYVVLLYAGIPAITLFLAKSIPNGGVVAVILGGVLGLFDLYFAWLVGYRNTSLMRVALLTTVLQFLLFSDFSTLRQFLPAPRKQIAFLLPPPRAKALLFALLVCLHFSLSWFPQIPAYLGGGKPLTVQVFPKTSELPANRFVDSKNHPRINKSLDSFSLHLLYETDKDVYFVDDLQSEDNLVGYYVMRLKRDEILRIDYNTPKWVQWRGAP
jgi:hypothetical protein